MNAPPGHNALYTDPIGARCVLFYGVNPRLGVLLDITHG